MCTESDDPWYSKSKKAEESAKSKRRKELMDPLNDMKHFVSQTKKLSEAHSTGASRVPLIATTLGSSTTVSHSASRHGVVDHSPVDRRERKKSEDGTHHKEHKSKSKKHKKRGKEREKEARLEEMRRQRRKREEAERAKAETMLRLHHSQNGGGGEIGGVSQEVEDTTGR